MNCSLKSYVKLLICDQVGVIVKQEFLPKSFKSWKLFQNGLFGNNVIQAGAELGQAQLELGLEDRVFMLRFEL